MSPAGRPLPAEVAAVPPSADRPIGLRLRWLGLRNRLLASPGFQRWAAAFPLTRPIARRRARELFDLCAGFVYSQILYACIDARLLDRLAGGPRPVTDLARDLGLGEAAAVRLLKAAATLRLVEPVASDQYALGELGAALLGNGGIAEMVRHHRMLYRDLDDPMALLRGERPQGDLGAYWAYAESPQPGDLDQTHTTGYTDLMAASQGLLSGDLLDAYPLRDRRCLLDIGGGNGAFLAAVAARWSHLQLKLFDLPSVAGEARQRFEREGIAPRAQAFGGDLFRDPLPEGADCCSLVRVIHDHDDGPALEILKAARRALPSGGVLILGEPMSGTPGAEPIGDAYFGFYLLAMGSGRPRTAEELTAMLRAAGFARVREVRTRRPLLTRLLVADVN
jgi:demethylspheroidene O-methyltransferase